MKKFLYALKNNVKFNATFYKSLISFIILIILIILIFVEILLNMYKSQIKRQAIDNVNKLTDQSIYYNQYTLNWATLYIYQLYLNDNIRKLMFEPNNYDSKVSKEIQTYLTLPEIQSIYIYNDYKKTFYSTFMGNTTLENFYDQDIVNKLYSQNKSISNTYLPRKVSYERNGIKYELNLLTIILANSKTTHNNLPNGAIILNLDADKLNNYFKYISGDTNIIVLDNNNRIVFSTNSYKYLHNMSNLNYIKKINNSDASNGTFYEIIDGKYSIVNFKISSNLKFITIERLSNSFNYLNNMSKLIIGSSVILCIFGIILSYILLKNFYSPIERTVDYVEKAVLNNGNSCQKDKLLFLMDTVKILASETNYLKKFSNDDIEIFKQQILDGLLHNNTKGVEKLLSKLNELNIKIRSECIIVSIIKIDYFNKLISSYSLKDIELINFAILNIVNELINKYFKYAELVKESEGKIALILSDEENNDFTIKSSINNFCIDLQEKLNMYLRISASIGIGVKVNDMYDIPKSYNTASDAVNYKFIYGKNAILFYEDIVKNLKQDYQYPKNIEDEIFNALKLNKYNEIGVLLSKLFDYLMQFSYEYIILTINQLSLNSRIMINKLYQINGKNNYIEINSFKYKIDNLENISDAKDFFLNLYKDTIDNLKEKNVNKKKVLLENILNYINNNYCNYELTPEVIASYANISLNHLRNIFKDEFNTSLTDYITELRLKKAKQMLELTNYPASKIANDVGFLNTNYFYTLFKKHYGVSPKQYRYNLLKTNNKDI
ncbi:helix-turn-helix transcriptional regulator [Thermoanaerobacterium thermosaccharolyticum]|uniref:helix-turn-helix domain-containing protein n=1 Tax=Thermoanaerobacterium thermosaccharolyticum TaxID=1517 RepID=UPI003DAA49C6